MSQLKEMTGQTFGRWTVLRRGEITSYGDVGWWCRCECGAEKNVSGTALRRGNARSCGCLQRELLTKRESVHRLRDHPLYLTWGRMKERCYYTKHVYFARYGGRGIKVCERWKNDFRAFYADNIDAWRPDLTLDRIDPHGDYSPENTRWATRLVQARNKSNTVMMTLNGETLPLVIWSEKTGIGANALRCRRIKGWSDEKALTTPVKERPVKTAPAL